MALAFVAFAAVQYNDPDPFLWIAMYLGAAIISLLPKLHAAVPGAYAAITLLGGAYLATRVIGQQHLLDSEEGREMLGLLLTGGWCATMAACSYWRR